MGGANRICCVVGCTNTEKKNPELQFYSFPNRPHMLEKKQKWIAAVRRVNWEPNASTRICSSHFEGGAKSEDPRKTAYVPTIFPDAYRKTLKTVKSNRTDRLIARNDKKSKSNPSTKQSVNKPTQNFELDSSVLDMHEEDAPSEPSDTEKPKYSEIAVQTDYYDGYECDDPVSILFCSTEGNEVSVQTNIEIRKSPKSKKVIVDEEELKNYEQTMKTCRNMASGCDSKDFWFTGVSSIHSDEGMRTLAGVSLQFFSVLLEQVTPGQDGQPLYYRTLSKENRLLLFLMKMKLGISFNALSWIFQVFRTTASTIFFDMLKTLIIKTKGWLFWPSRYAVQKTMPASFKNYPNCRAIIDCTELHAETPSKVSDRILMFSNYKGGFTWKYLIAITASGLIIFISKGYGGRSTDGFIVNDSGFLDYLEPGDEVLADKGFPQIKTEILQRQCTIVIPPFAFQPQFTKEEVMEDIQ